MKAAKLTAILTLALGLSLVCLGLLSAGSLRAARADTYTVTNTNDSGTGSLRQAIIDANSHSGPDTINFGIPGLGPHTIHLLTELPDLTDDQTTINGYTQSGASPATDEVSATIMIEIDGSAIGGGTGLDIHSDMNYIRGLAINGLDRGVRIDSGADNNRIAGNYIGTDASGISIVGNIHGVEIYGTRNIIGGDEPRKRNVISGNGSNGVNLGSTAMTNTISGNYIGTDATGSVALGNGLIGVSIGNGARNNVVGGSPATRNTVSGNGVYGITIGGSDTAGNVVASNYIGTDRDGITALPNDVIGVLILGGAHDNIIGGDTVGERNIISGNDGPGVQVFGSDTTSNTISGNFIGTDRHGTTALPNSTAGVDINGAQYTTVGGGTASERNIISGNGFDGVSMANNAAHNTICGNYIGVNVYGTDALSNTASGVAIGGGAHHNIIGGAAAGEANIISGNGDDGVEIRDSGTATNTVAGNYIGIDANVTGALSNGGNGVLIHMGSENNTVGPGNFIAYNTVGVHMSGGTGNAITQNIIFGNISKGINLTGGANHSIPTPVIVTATVGSINVVGTACPNCTVEVFANGDDDGEGETYIGAGTATAGGAFTVPVTAAIVLVNPYLTATSTDVVSGTSEFSTVYIFAVKKAYLPLILKD